MRHFHIATIALCTALAGCAGSQPDGVAVDVSIVDAPDEVAENRAAFREAGLAALDAQMKQFVKDGHIHGIHTRLVHEGQIIAETRFGLRDTAASKPIEDDTIYRIYSMTKPITGVAMMQLYEQGMWQLDDPVTKYIPEFSELLVLDGQDAEGHWGYVPADRPPTMKEVLNHTAGFAYGLWGDDPANSAFREEKIFNSKSLGEFINRTADIPLVSQPGQKWVYSASVDIQGALVERISGQSFGEYLKEHIFAPLGMSDTAFYVPDEKSERFSQVFGYNSEGDLVQLPPDRVLFGMSYKKESLGMESGGAGLVSTMDDYSAFAQAMLNGGELNGARILEAETVQLMATNTLASDMKMGPPQRGWRNPDGLGFGLGFAVMTDPSLRDAAFGQGTFYWSGAAGTWFWIDPENDLYFVGMIQRFPAGAPEEVDIRIASAKLVYEAMAR